MFGFEERIIADYRRVARTSLCPACFSSECSDMLYCMERHVSARDANQNFSRILREVRGGKTFIITSHDTPVARISPVSDFDQTARSAQAALFKRLRAQRAVKAGKWTREDLYVRGDA